MPKFDEINIYAFEALLTIQGRAQMAEFERELSEHRTKLGKLEADVAG